METISNAANAAAKAVWGDGHSSQEPVSGQQGDTSRGEPFDAGNKDLEEKNQSGSAGGLPIDEKNKNDTTGGQNDTRKPEQLSMEEKTDVDSEAPGPKPLDTVAKEHAGDAGNEHNNPTQTSSTEQGHDEEQETNENKGTGEEYVKATGLAADGGDFDATRPGAGREADRLMDEKGMHRDDTSASKGSADSAGSKTSSGDHSDKPKLGERIKAKFHKS